MCVCVRTCACACVRACVRACVCVCVCMRVQALQEAQALSREMKEKFVKKNNEFRAAQDVARNNELRLKKEIDEYRTKVTNLSETMTARTLEHELKIEESAARYEKEIEQLKDHNNKLLNDMDAALRSEDLLVYAAFSY